MKPTKSQQQAKKSKPIDLSEYEEEAVPFDAVIRKLAHAKPAHKAPTRKAKRRAK